MQHAFSIIRIPGCIYRDRIRWRSPKNICTLRAYVWTSGHILVEFGSWLIGSILYTTFSNTHQWNGRKMDIGFHRPLSPFSNRKQNMSGVFSKTQLVDYHIPESEAEITLSKSNPLLVAKHGKVSFTYMVGLQVSLVHAKHRKRTAAPFFDSPLASLALWKKGLNIHKTKAVEWEANLKGNVL